jgi:hypothetical protein
LSGKIRAVWTFSIKFPYDTQFTFGSLMLATREDGNLELLTRGPPPKHFVLVYGQTPYLLANSSTSGGACSGLNPYPGPYHRAVKSTQGIPIEAPIFQPSVGTSSYSTLAASPDQDSTDDYPEIGGSAYWNSVDKGSLIIMVVPTKAPLKNNSNRYPTIGRSEASDTRTLNDGMIRNLNLDFNAVWL